MNHETRVQRMMFPQSNQSLQAFGMYTDAEKYLWIAWLMVILIVSVAGNLTVLIGSIRYNAIQLNKVTTTLVIHTAISDLGLIFTTIPTMISLIMDTLVYGETYCEIFTWINGLFVRSSCLLVTAISCSKLANIIWPFKSSCWTKRRGNKVAIAVWVVAVILICFKALSKHIAASETILMPSTLSCVAKITEKLSIASTILSVESLLSRAVPMTIVVITALWLLAKVYIRQKVFQGVQQIHRRVKLPGVIAVLAIVAVFIFSFAPLYCMIVYQLLQDTQKKHTYLLQMIRWFNNLAYLNCMLNVFIYSVTFKTFNIFVTRKVIPFLLPCRRTKRRIGLELMPLNRISKVHVIHEAPF